jgi:hypothetical protein
MARHLSANSRLLEDVHRLKQEWIDHPDVMCHRGEFGRSTERVEDRIEVMHRMSELVERKVWLGAERAVLIEGILFEETTDLLAAREEIVVTRVERFTIGSEDRGFLR